MDNFISALQQRGMLHSMSAGIEKHLANERTSGYVGFDPTAPSLHIGNLATMMLLKHLQLAGHRPVVLLGGATGMIGDLSFKSSERVLLDRDLLIYHQEVLKKQMSFFLDFSSKGGALLVNNYDWFKQMGLLPFLRDVGKHLSINYMMAKESVKTRLRSGISYTEFAYQLLQGYDFYYLRQHHNVALQMGGADQWGNITTGIELIRKKMGVSAYGLTSPLLTKSDGTKFGKTEAGNVWLDPKMTSPYSFYQFWLNCSDEESLKLIKHMTLYNMEEIAEIVTLHKEAPHKRILQKRIGEAVTCFVHSKAAYQQAVKVSETLFGGGSSEALASLEEENFLACLLHIPHIEIPASRIAEAHSIVDLLVDLVDRSIFSSKRQARELIAGGALRLNNKRVTDIEVLPEILWIHNKYLLVQKGKKHFYLIKRIF